MPYRRGDVLLLLFPCADLTRIKKRPALVVQNPPASLVEGDPASVLVVQDEGIDTNSTGLIVALITSNLTRESPSRIKVEHRTRLGTRMGLQSDSVIVADNLATVEPRHIDKRLGVCFQMNSVDAALRMVLGL